MRAGVHVVDHAAAGWQPLCPIDGGHALDARADHGVFGTQQRHRLARHVRAHQRAVGVVVLQEGTSEAATDTICAGDTSMSGWLGIAPAPMSPWRREDQFAGRKLAGGHRREVGLGNDVLAFFMADRWTILVVTLPSPRGGRRRSDETVLVQAGVQRQRVDQADVRAFWRFDRADAAVVGDDARRAPEAGTLRVRPPGPGPRRGACA